MVLKGDSLVPGFVFEPEAESTKMAPAFVGNVGEVKVSYVAGVSIPQNWSCKASNNVPAFQQQVIYKKSASNNQQSVSSTVCVN